MFELARRKEEENFRLLVGMEWKDYNCECGQMLFRAKLEPVGFEIRCPKCRKLVQYGFQDNSPELQKKTWEV